MNLLIKKFINKLTDNLLTKFRQFMIDLLSIIHVIYYR